MDDQNVAKQWIMEPLLWAAGFAGSVISSFHIDNNLSLKQKLVSIISGGLFVGFMVPAIADHLALKLLGYICALSFIVGLTAMMLTVGILKLAIKFRDNPSGVILWGLETFTNVLKNTKSPPNDPPEAKS